MTRRQKIAAALATAATAASGYYTYGVMAPPAPNAVPATFIMRGPCGRMKGLARVTSDVKCKMGQRVYVAAEVAVDLTMAPAEELKLPPRIRVLKKSFRRVRKLKNPDRAFTILGNAVERPGWCLGGKVRRLTSDPSSPEKFWTPKKGWGICCGDGCECAGARCARICPPHVYAGDTCDVVICEKWPRLPGCSDA